jgi:formate dehydrogenase accessory protein FdhE
MATRRSIKTDSRYRPIRESLDSALQGMERLRDRDGVSPDYLDLQMKLVKLRKQAISRIVNTPRIAKHLTEKLNRDALADPDGKAPIVEAATLTLEEFGTLADQYAFPENILAAARALQDIEASDKAQIEQIIQGILYSTPQAISNVGAALSLDARVLHFLGRELLKPFFHVLAANHFDRETAEKWNQGRCPICSGYPQFARLDKENGARWLHCDLCDIEWKFERMTCPFCGNVEVGKARYFTVSDDDPMRVAVCDKCQCYIKTYDERKENVKIQPLVEDVGSLALDMIAFREGFVHPNLAMAFT